MNRLYIIILISIGFLVYFNSLFNNFVWDDEEQVLNAAAVHSITNLPLFFSSSTFNGGGTGSLEGLYYKPLMTTFFSLIYTTFGPNAFFFHLMQLGFHITSAVFLFLIFNHFFPKKEKLSFILALIFLIHPINTEAVVYISDLQDILYFFFGVTALYLVIKYPLNWSKTFWLFILFLCSFLSKETGMIFILVTGIFILLYRKQQLRYYLTALGGTLAIYSLLRFVIAKIFFNKHGLSPITTMNFEERLLSIPQIILTYLRNFLFPQNLAINQHWAVRTVNWESFYLPLILEFILLGVSLVLGFLLYQKDRRAFLAYLFFFLWFGMSLGMHLHIFPLDLTVSDRWFYLPSAALLGMLGVIIYEFEVRNARFIKVITFITIIIIISLSIRTFIRNFDWKDGLTLYGHDIQISKESFDLENNYGVELFRAKKYEEAVVHFQRSTELAPKWWTNWNNLGVIYERSGDYDKAGEYYKKAIDNGNYYLAYENYASILLFHKDAKLAKDFIEESLTKLPYNSKLWFLLALADYKVGDKQGALLAAKNAHLLSPSTQTQYIYSRLSQDQPLEF